LFAALVARDVESLALTCLSSSAAEVGPSRIAAWLTTFWMSQITFPVILLFAFSKCERRVALRTRYLEVWHRGFSMKAESRNSTFFALRSAGVAFLSSTKLWSESAGSQTLRRKARVPTGYGRECTPANNGIQLLCVAESRQEIPEVWRVRNSAVSKSRIYLLLSRHIACSLIDRSMDHLT
jgi:hypothetical protein